MEITIGKHPNNSLIIDENSISKYHCKVYKTPGKEIIIEDLNSTNGVQVDGMFIQRFQLFGEEKVQIGTQECSVAFLLDLVEGEKAIEGKPMAELEEKYLLKEEFKLLEEVYTKYIKKKKKIKRGTGLKQSGIRAGLSLIPIVGRGLGAMAAGAVNTTNQIMDLEEQFKIDYVCPKCKMFLGNTPFEGLVQRKACRSCKTDWV